MVKVSIENNLHERAKKVAAAEGYSSVDEFITHAIEAALKRSEADAAESQVTDQLRGLGYIE
jgi:metal-responsive CopG/Arc/MetJ family transcriptional regulator